MNPGSRSIWIIPLIAWLAIVLASFAWNLRLQREQGIKIASHQAETIHALIKAERFRSAVHGGLFVPEASVPDRPDSRSGIVIPESMTMHGFKLTKINPAYLSEQVVATGRTQRQLVIHITSMRPVNPFNRPDEWEVEQLRSFEQGGRERLALVGADDRRIFRYMAPLFTEQECLRCHEQHGFRRGDVRGGISITFPARPVFAVLDQQRTTMIVAHAGVFLTVSLLIMAFARQLRRQWLTLEAARVNQERLIAERTWALTSTNTTLRQENELRKMTEEHYLQLNRDLEQRVAERTAELQAANSELEAFCYSVAHDLQAPLRGMDGFSKILLERFGDTLDEEGRYCLQRVSASSTRMGQLVDDLLHLSKVTRMAMRRTTVDLSVMAQEIMDECIQSNPERRITYRIQPGLLVQGDENLLRIALVNLLTNAVKFSGNVPEARIEVGSCEREGKSVYFVRDNGVGFDMAHAGRLFGPFERLVKATEFEGTGIGLATVKRIVERHGGTVWPEAEPGKGATFFFTLL